MPTVSCPECKTKIQVASLGGEVTCPECHEVFVTAAKAAAKPAVAAAKPAVAAQPVAAPPPPPPKPRHDDDDVNPYGVAQESEEEKALAAKNKPKFGDVADKFKKSAKGPASALLVMPVNLLIAQAALLGILGVGMVIVGFWPIIFTDAPPSMEEIVEQLTVIFLGAFFVLWAAITCYGAYQMSALGSYAWSIVGSTFGLLPLLAGIFGLVTLRDPRVIAGFEEPEGGPNQNVDEPKKKDNDEDDEDDDD